MAKPDKADKIKIKISKDKFGKNFNSAIMPITRIVYKDNNEVLILSIPVYQDETAYEKGEEMLEHIKNYSINLDTEGITSGILEKWNEATDLMYDYLLTYESDFSGGVKE